MEEAFDKVNGVIDVVSGYSGGTTENPSYKEVVYGKTGHFEAIEIKYDSTKIKYKDLLEAFWINIDPFDADGQFCDKGYSYRSVAFYKVDVEKNYIENDKAKEIAIKNKIYYIANKCTKIEFKRLFGII